MTRGEYIAREALSYRGVRYVFGGSSRRGIDCSALAQAACRKWGLMLPRTSTEQFHRGVPVAKDQLRPGDLVFFKNTYRHGISHVGIYVGDGKFVHAAGRRLGVIVSSLSSAHYQNHYAGARRLSLDKEPEQPTFGEQERNEPVDPEQNGAPPTGAAAEPPPTPSVPAKAPPPVVDRLGVGG